jgi:succinoglycan biosynthesis transport protein ExoP
MPRVVAVASAGPDPARTTCTLALAQLARMQGRRSVFVECDFLDSPARRQFAIPGRRGLLSVLRGEAAYHEVLHIDQQTGLHIVPGEAGAVDPGAAFDPARFGEFAEILRRTYDCVYVDVAGPLDAPALRAVARWCDALLCLLPDGETPEDAVLAALADLADAGPRAVGVAYRRSAAADSAPAAVAPAPQPPVAPGPVRPATAAEACGEEGARADPNVLYMFREIRDAR